MFWRSKLSKSKSSKKEYTEEGIYNVLYSLRTSLTVVIEGSQTRLDVIIKQKVTAEEGDVLEVAGHGVQIIKGRISKSF